MVVALRARAGRAGRVDFGFILTESLRLFRLNDAVRFA